jgi:hypothetical protein
MVTHFGNGDETDQKLLLDFCSNFGRVTSITILPGTNYGHIEMDSLAAVNALMTSLATDDTHSNNNAVNIGPRTLVFFNTTITKEGLKRQ